jgi:hypothetical protein
MHKKKRFIAAVVMSLTYGYDVKESSDHFVVVAEELLTLARKSMSPGALLVNDLPACTCCTCFFLKLFSQLSYSKVPARLVPWDGVQAARAVWDEALS